MVDFTQLLKKPAGMAKKPPALPIGVYSGIISGWEPGDNNKNKTPYVRFTIKLAGWPEDFSPSPEELSIDLSKRAMRRDFFLTDDALWRLDLLIRSCGIDPTEREYFDILPEMIGQMVSVEVQQYLNQQSGEIGNQLGQVIGPHEVEAA